jgi:Raf kinase inhibitor-like YbhB/YbcL family protein
VSDAGVKRLSRTGIFVTRQGYHSSMSDLQLRSPAFSDQERIPDRFSRLGGNVSPPLTWPEVPREALELLLICEDPDAPHGTFLHWLVTGIDPATRSVDEGRVPVAGREWPNSFGESGWGGPQPPPGDEPHRYIFQLHALVRPAHMPPRPGIPQIHEVIKAAGPLASGTLTGTFSR